MHTQDGNFGKIPGGHGTALARDESIMAASSHALQSSRPIITMHWACEGTHSPLSSSHLTQLAWQPTAFSLWMAASGFS